VRNFSVYLLSLLTPCSKVFLEKLTRLQLVITDQFSKSGTRNPLREYMYYVWWSQENLCVYRIDKQEDNRGCSLQVYSHIFLSLVS
jgi:hypothetical protein